MENTNRLLNAQEVALLVGVSVPMLTMWYKWKSLHQDDERAKMLPEYMRVGSATQGKRLWKYEDVYKIIEFRQQITMGRKGFLGEVTQKYVKKKEKK